ncbi:MAG TPA: alpha/beta fold hydrolase [Candidatus Angelobacter sp.]
MYCFPYAGGSAQVFRSWQRHFPAQVDVCPVQLPGRGKRISEPPFTNVKSLVQAIADGIFDGSPDPFIFFGHSMGALISFELARELRRRGSIGPRQLFLSGRRGPTVPQREAPTFNLPHDEFIAELKRLKGTPPELLNVPEAAELFFPLLRADFEVVDTYMYENEEPLSCPITVYGGLQDEFVTREDLREWEKQTCVTYKERMFSGDHFFIHDPKSEFLNVLLTDVVKILDTLDGERRPR